MSGPLLVLTFPAPIAPPAVPHGDELAALLQVWTPREWFRHCARTGLPLDRAMRERRQCRRCQGVAYPRLSRIAWEEYRRMLAEAAEAGEGTR